jgi:PAS domain-containing protein
VLEVKVNIDDNLASAAAVQSWIIWIMVIIMTVTAAVVFVLYSKMVERPLKMVSAVAASIAGGKYDNEINYAKNDEMGDVFHSLTDMQSQLFERIEKDRLQARRIGRIKSALDASASAVMVTSDEHDILYLNDALQSLLQQNQVKMQSVFPEFTTDLEILTQKKLGIFFNKPDQQQRMVENLLTPHSEEIAVSDLIFKLTYAPILDEGERSGTVIEWQDLTERRQAEKKEKAKIEQERIIAAQNNRVTKALDYASANIMIANPDYEIIYVNSATEDTFSAAEAGLVKDLPDLNVNALVGTNMDAFHKNPAHQRQILDGLTEKFESQVNVGGHSFKILANPVIDSGERLGPSLSGRISPRSLNWKMQKNNASNKKPRWRWKMPASKWYWIMPTQMS